MKCNRCSNERAYRMRFWQGGECCDKCGGLRNLNVPDVYFDKPYVDPHLIDINDIRQKDGVLIESKQHKKMLMDKLKVKEAGDKFHGARQEFKRMNGAFQI